MWRNKGSSSFRPRPLGPTCACPWRPKKYAGSPFPTPRANPFTTLPTSCWTTSFAALPNTNSFWALGTSAKVAEYQVLDETGQQQGSFYTQIDGVLTSQLTICYGEEQYDCYPRSIGKY